MRTIGELTALGRIKQGTHFRYRPEVGEYQTDPEKTGCESIHLVTDESPYYDLHYEDWIVSEVLSDGSIEIKRYWISPFFLDMIELKGISGFMYGPIELENMCRALFSSPSLGITARCITIKDEKYAVKVSKSQHPRQKAFYPSSMKNEYMSGSVTLTGDIDCKKRVCRQEEKFKHRLAGGIEIVDDELRRWYVPEKDNPVCVTETGFLPHHGTFQVKQGYWLPSTAEWFDDDYQYRKDLNGGEVCYGLSISDQGSINNQVLFNSSGQEFSAKNAITPIVHIPSHAQIIEESMSPYVPKEPVVSTPFWYF